MGRTWAPGPPPQGRSKQAADTGVERKLGFPELAQEPEMLGWFVPGARRERGQGVGSWSGRAGQRGGGWSLHALLPRKKLPFYISIRRDTRSISSTTRGSRAQPSSGPLQLLLMNLLSGLPTFLYANEGFMGPVAIRTH